MSIFDWQLTVVIACVAWAAFSLGRRVRRLFSAGKSSCGTCGGCNTDEQAGRAEPNIVPVDSLRFTDNGTRPLASGGRQPPE